MVKHGMQNEEMQYGIPIFRHLHVKTRLIDTPFWRFNTSSWSSPAADESLVFGNYVDMVNPPVEKEHLLLASNPASPSNSE